MLDLPRMGSRAYRSVQSHWATSEMQRHQACPEERGKGLAGVLGGPAFIRGPSGEGVIVAGVLPTTAPWKGGSAFSVWSVCTERNFIWTATGLWTCFTLPIPEIPPSSLSTSAKGDCNYCQQMSNASSRKADMPLTYSWLLSTAGFNLPSQQRGRSSSSLTENQTKQEERLHRPCPHPHRGFGQCFLPANLTWSLVPQIPLSTTKFCL